MVKTITNSEELKFNDFKVIRNCVRKIVVCASVDKDYYDDVKRFAQLQTVHPIYVTHIGGCTCAKRKPNFVHVAFIKKQSI